MGALSVEGKMVWRIRNLLKADATIADAFGDRIYDSHISTIYQPAYPAISIQLMTSEPRDELTPEIRAIFQIDVWVKEEAAGKRDLYDYQAAIRKVMHRPLCNYDSVTGLTLMFLDEMDSGPLLFDAAANLWYMGKRYEMRGI